MRVNQGRGNRGPSNRLPQLKRYAFIGDSTMYGIGVAPDETLPAHAEEQFNERLRSWPVETVNFGISGYNLVNSWLGFKQRPQVFDGLVVALCPNDADCFGHSYRVKRKEPLDARWDQNQPLGRVVAACFDDMARFTAAHAMPVAVCYYNAFAGAQERIAPIIGQLCEARGFAFVDSYALYRERHFQRDDTVVSKADSHPSALAHQAVARALTTLVERQGWFSGLSGEITAGLAEAIMAAARGMIDRDHYSADIALNWALRALAAKRRLARRLQVGGAEDQTPIAEFLAAAKAARDALVQARILWHGPRRINAFAGKIAASTHDLVWVLVEPEEARLKLDEIAFVLKTSRWNEFAASLPELANTANDEADLAVEPAFAFLRQCRRNVAGIRDALRVLQGLARASAAFPLPDREPATIALQFIFDFADRIAAECRAQETAILGVQSGLRMAGRELSPQHRQQITLLANAEIARLSKAFGFLSGWPECLRRLGDDETASFTTIEVTFNSPAPAVSRLANLIVNVRYSIPLRLKFGNGMGFAEGQAGETIKLRVPLFYCAQLTLLLWTDIQTDEPFDITILTVAAYNHPNRRASIDPSKLVQTANHQFISPVIYID